MIVIDEIVVFRGGGDIASGAIYRLHQCGFKVAVLELPQPLVVRRAVSFAQAVVDGEITIEGVKAIRIGKAEEMNAAWDQHCIQVLVDPEAKALESMSAGVVVDGTIAKKNPGTHRGMAPITIALGPGFTAGADVDAVIETLEGHNLGKVIYSGPAAPDTGLSVPLMGYSAERVLRAPCTGTIKNRRSIGDAIAAGEIVACVDGAPVAAAIAGILHGLIQDGMHVKEGLKIGDIDPRGVKSYCYTIFDKARAIGGGVLEAILHLSALRSSNARAVA